jgi:hypothetical protein
MTMYEPLTETELETLSSIPWEEIPADMKLYVAVSRADKLHFLFEQALQQEPPNMTLICAISGLARRVVSPQTMQERSRVLDMVKLASDIDKYFETL